MEIVNSILTQPLWSVLTGLVGFYFGQRFNLWRDKRKEFNEIAEKIFIDLSSERNNITPMWSVQKIDFEILRRRLPFWKRRGFSKCVENYYGSKKENYRKHANGSVYFQDTTSIAAAIDELLKFTDRK